MSEEPFEASRPAPSALPAAEVEAPEADASVPKDPPREESSSLWSSTMGFLRGFLRDLAFFVFLFLFIYYFVMNVSVVRGKSMEPNFHDGDRLIVDKLTYRLTDITTEDRFDVVVLKNPLDPSEDYIKRLVAFPGEWVEIKNGVLYIDGEEFEESGIYLDATREYGPVRVREGHFFVLGDNRAHSNDSLNFGGVPKDYIKGKIRARFWPFDDLQFFR